MSIPEAMIMRHLDMLLTGSEPGSALHHLHVIAAPLDKYGPLGLLAEADLRTAVYAIAYTQEAGCTLDEFIGRIIRYASIEHAKNRQLILFAALSQEIWQVEPLDDLARQLIRQGRLYEHPNMAEITVVYAACSDGRRWLGRHWHTGPRAGETSDATVLVGRPHPREAPGAAASLVRKLVGLKD